MHACMLQLCGSLQLCLLVWEQHHACMFCMDAKSCYCIQQGGARPRQPLGARVQASLKPVRSMGG